MTRAKRRWETVRLPLLAEAMAIFSREWRTEWRTRVAVSSTGLFALCSLTLVAMSIARATSSVEMDAGLLWIVLLFTAAVGLGRAFLQEEERGTILALRLTAHGNAVWLGKFAANVVLLWGLTVVAAPLLMLFLKVAQSNLALLICVLVLGDVGIAAVFTTTGALVAQSTARGGLLAALSFPLLVPLLGACVHGTQAAFGAGLGPRETISFARGVGDLQILTSYAVIAITGSLMLFDFIWSD